MKQNESEEKEVSPEEFIEEILQLQLTAPGEGPVICHACGHQLEAGAQVSVYAYRTDRHQWAIGQTRCGAHPLALTTQATLGVTELTITGRIGHYTDHTYQQSCPILLDPHVDAHSPPHTTTTNPMEAAR